MSSLVSRRAALAGGASALVVPKARARRGGGNRTPYLGSIASRCIVTEALDTAITQVIMRSRHLCYSSVTGVQVVFPNFYVNQTAGTEIGWGATSTIYGYVEYSGTLYPLTFSGSASGSIASGSFLVSDLCSVTIPAGAYFFIRWLCTCSAGIGYVGLNSGGLNFDSANGEATVSGTGSLTPSNLIGTITYNTSFACTPIAIIGQTTNPSCMLLGDSRCVGIYDSYITTGVQQTLIGEVARWVGQSFAYSNFGVSGASLKNWLLSNTQQLLLSVYFSHIICEYGINDFGAQGETAQQMIANVEAARALFLGKPFFQTTTVITSGSTDNWATTGNQTPNSDNAQVQAFNAAIRAGSVQGITGFFDSCAAVENPALSGKWITNGTANYATFDGTHEVQQGNLLIAAALASQVASAIHF